MTNELIEQIGGRERLVDIKSRIEMYGHGAGYTADEVELMARALLAVLDAKPKYFMRVDEDFGLEINSINEFSGGGEGIALYTTPPAASAPDGWQLVPVEPTQAMIDSGMECASAAVYRRMLSAAPAPGDKK